MSEQALQLPLPGFEQAEAEWRRDYGARMGPAANPRNRSGIEVKPLYSAADWSAGRYMADLGFPGQLPMTRGRSRWSVASEEMPITSTSSSSASLTTAAISCHGPV